MKKAIIIITTNDRKEDRFINCQSANDHNYYQEWVDGWGFRKDNLCARRFNEEKFLELNDLKNLLDTIKDNSIEHIIIWFNLYKITLNNLNGNLKEVIDALSVNSFQTRIAMHQRTEDIKNNYKENSVSYSLSTNNEKKFCKVIITDEGIKKLDPNASFEDIEEVFFQPLENLKKKIINLWLPLAIDIQGLSEVEEGKKKGYYKEIRDELLEKNKEYYIKLVTDWNDLKDNIKNDNIDVNTPTRILDEIIKTEPQDAFEKLNGNNKKVQAKFYKIFILDKNKNNFLPNWLQKAVEIIDTKISKTENPTTGKTVQK